MDDIERYNAKPVHYVKSSASPGALVIHSLPAFTLWVGALTVLSLFVLMLSILAGFQHGSALLHPNPAANYMLLWPGQPVSSVAAYVRQNPKNRTVCYSGVQNQQETTGLPLRAAQWAASDPADRSILCEITPSDGIFRLMTVNIDQGAVQTLTLRSDVLQLDALFLYWGVPDVITHAGGEQVLSMEWNRSTYRASASVNGSTSAVRLVTLTATDRDN